MISSLDLSSLTPRETQVFEQIIAGRSNKVIGSILGLSPKTVEFHVTNLYVKLGVRSRCEALSLVLGINACPELTGLAMPQSQGKP